MPDLPGSYADNGFHRQRRNLLVGSIVLFFIRFADVRLGTQGSLFGIPITIGKPDAIQWFLYVGVLYWGWRFYTFHRQRRPIEMTTKAREFMFGFLQKRAIATIQPSPPAFVAPQISAGQRIESCRTTSTLDRLTGTRSKQRSPRLGA
jgi:hypothetical protein